MSYKYGLVVNGCTLLLFLCSMLLFYHLDYFCSVPNRMRRRNTKIIAKLVQKPKNLKQVGSFQVYEDIEKTDDILIIFKGKEMLNGNGKTIEKLKKVEMVDKLGKLRMSHIWRSERDLFYEHLDQHIKELDTGSFYNTIVIRYKDSKIYIISDYITAVNVSNLELIEEIKALM